MKTFEIFQRVVSRMPVYLRQLVNSFRKNGILNTFRKIFKKIFRFVVTGGDGSKLMRFYSDRKSVV